MESSIYGVPMSTEQVGPSNSTISGIRAPLTMDESNVSYSTGSSYYSGSEVEGSESGEDMLETARLVGENEGIVEETGLVKEFAFSEGAVVGLNGEVIAGSSSCNDRGFIQESGSVGGNADFRPLARIPNGISYRVVGNFVDSDDSGSFLSDSGDDELAEDEKDVSNHSNFRSFVDEGVLEEEVKPAMGIRVRSAQKLSLPVAKISGDSDDDSRGSEVLDDDGFSGIARFPSVEVLRRINSALNSRMSEGNEGGENELEGEDVVETEIGENLLDGGMVFSPLDEEEPIVVENSLVQDFDLDFNEEKNDEFNPASELGVNGGLIRLDEEIKEVDVVDDWKECFELADRREPADFVELSNVSDAAFVDESEFLCDKLTVDVADAKSTNESDQAIESYETNSAHQCKEVPAEGSCEFQEFSASFPGTVSFEDASLTCAVAANQSVSEGSKLELESGEETETSNLLLPAEVEQSSFYSDNKAVIAEVESVQDSVTPHTVIDHSQEIDCQVVEDFHDEVNIAGGMSGQGQIIDPPPAVDAPCNEVRSAVSDDDDDDDDIKFVSVDGIEGSFDSARPSIAERNPSSVDPCSTIGETEEGLSEGEKEKISKIQEIVVKYLRLLDGLGFSPEDYVASEVLNALSLAAGSSYLHAFHIDSFKIASMELESHKKDELDLQLSVLIIGKTGVGKSATINSIFGETVAAVDAFEPATKRVKETIGLIHGVKLKIFDTPGLRTSSTDQSINRKILSSIKKMMKKSPPDVVLYVDRLDTQRSHLTDLPLLRLVTSCLGSSIWRKSIVVFTHGTSLPPDGPNDCPLSYEAFFAHQSQAIQRLISQSAGEPVVMRSGLVPVCVIANHQFTEKNGGIERWRSQLLLLCCSIKILSEMSSPVMSQSLLGLASSSLLSNVHRELSNDQSGYIASSEASAESEVVPFAEAALPPSLYHVLESSWGLLTRPVLNSHNCNFEGLLIEDNITIANYTPVLISVQLTKEQRELIVQLHSSEIKNLRKNKTAAGVSITFLAQNMESDRFAVSGVIQSQDNAAYGVNFDLCRREKNHPFNHDETSMRMSVVRCRDELTYGCNLHSQISLSRKAKLDMTAALDNRLRGQICVKMSSSDQLQIAALALLPIARAVVKKLFGHSTE